MPDSDRHLDLLQLDALRAGEAVDPIDATHAAGCPRCQAALTDLAALAGDLKALHAPALGAVHRRDASVLWLARTQAAGVRRRRGWRQRLVQPVTWAAAAVALLALASAVFFAHRPVPQAVSTLARVAPVPPGAPAASIDAASADVDGDGRVTVLDALALARARDTRGTGLDANRDTAADDKVNAVLALAVSLRGT